MTKIVTVNKLANIILQLKKKKKKIVHCHGAFDLLHSGHINHFREAKKFGDILIVTVTQDKYVNKGPNRPVLNLNARIDVLSSIKEIDYLAANIFSDAVKLIKTLKPNFYCKGKDYKNHSFDVTEGIIKELKAIKSVGGKLVYTESKLFSSSKIINEKNYNLTNEQKKFLDLIKKNKKFNSNQKIFEVINTFLDLKVLVIGETIIDEYIYCEALGKSGKEPMLVSRELYKERYIGGTAAIARNLSSFIKKITLLTNLGEKKEEIQFMKKSLEKNIQLELLFKYNSPTIIKKRFIEHINKTKIFGAYLLNDEPLNRYQEIEFNKKIRKLINKHDLIIVSDYGHGLISDNTAKYLIENSKFIAVNTQLNSSNVGFHVISKYANADFITINETEMRHELRDKTSDRYKLIKTLAKKLNSKYTHVTSGDVGSLMFNNLNKEIISCPAFANKVVDKIGTGDSMLSILALSIFKKIDVKFSMLISAIVAAHNIQNMANKLPINKINIIRALQSYLK